MSRETIYLDNAATTGVHPDVLEAMLPFLGAAYGNPSSVHGLGRAARHAVEDARERVARVLHCEPAEIVFTSCGTEGINLAIKGIARAAGEGGRVITTAIEHHAALHAAEQLAGEGYEVEELPVSADGVLDPAAVERALRPDTRLISVMYANNEIGTVQPIEEVAHIGERAGVPVFTDAVQAAGALPLDVRHLGVTALALSGHKFRAPKGVGVLYLREGTPIRPQLVGGSQERGLRAGTENVAHIVGIAAALERAQARREEYAAHCAGLRDRIFERLAAALPDVRINGDRERRLPNNAHVSFRGVEAQGILMGLDMQGICASSGSACVSASLEPSQVLTAIGVPEEYVYGSLRLSLGEETTPQEVERALEVLPPLVQRLQALSPLLAAS